MYLLYLDDAGSVSNASDKHVVLAGIALFERQVHFLDGLLEDFAGQIAPAQAELLEFHASHMLAGKGFWRSIPDRAQRRRHLAEALSQVDKLRGQRALFGVVVEKSSVPSQDALEFAFEQIVRRFDLFLSRFHQAKNTQRGLLILDKSTMETRLQQLTRTFRRTGHSWGRPRNLVDVPFFVDSAATRAIQYADMVAYALWRAFEKDDKEFFHTIESAFDQHGGVRHGLFVQKREADDA